MVGRAKQTQTMCGRFALGLARNQIQRVHGHRGMEAREWVDEDRFVPRFNIAPHSLAPVLRRREGGPSDAGEGNAPEFFLQTMRWGLVPHWAKFEDKSLNTINARSENLVAGGGMWNSIKGRKRCVVLAQGYYEWQKKGKERIPYFTKFKDDKLILFAGLYDCTVLEGEKDPLWTFTIVTTMSNKDFEWLHERQPVILSSRAAVDAWLDTSSQKWTDELTKLVEPFHDDSSPLECYQVPKEVGKVGAESKTFIEPVAKRKDGIQALFLKMSQSSPNKRKRSPSPPGATDSQESQGTFEAGNSSSKKPRDSKTVSQEVESTPPPDAPISSKDTKSPSRLKSPEKASPSRKSPRKVQPSQKNKITMFFPKSS